MPVEIREIVLRAEIVDTAPDTPLPQATQEVDVQALRDELIQTLSEMVADEFRKREVR